MKSILNEVRLFVPLFISIKRQSFFLNERIFFVTCIIRCLLFISSKKKKITSNRMNYNKSKAIQPCTILIEQTNASLSSFSSAQAK